MNKRRLTNRQQLRKRLKEAEPGSILYKELAAIQASIEKPREKAVPELIKLLKLATTQEAKHFIAPMLGSAKDPRVIRPLMKAATAPENENYSSDFLWPLLKYDCTKHLKFFADFIVALPDPGEAMMAAVMIIREMKVPFEPAVARSCIRKLLAEIKTPMDGEWKLQTEAFRLEAADYIITKYFNQMRQAYWKPRNGSVSISKTH